MQGLKGNYKHLGCHTRLYNIWKTMRQRCLNPNARKFYRYGALGISICAEWEDFSKFREWSLANGYSDELTLDRIDVYGNYEPNNCRWADAITQANNKTNNHIIEYMGCKYTLADFCRKYKLKYKSTFQALSRGKNIEYAMENLKIS